MPVRIYDIAKKFGLESKEILTKAKALGIAAAKVPSSSLDKISAEWLEVEFLKDRPDVVARLNAPPAAEPPKPAPPEEKIVFITAPKPEPPPEVKPTPAPEPVATAPVEVQAQPEPSADQPPAPSAPSAVAPATPPPASSAQTTVRRKSLLHPITRPSAIIASR
jgi:translation initiation factor IF-2